MTTEIQVGRNRIHVSYLRTIVSRTARESGLSKRDVQRIEDAVCQACLRSFAVGEDECRPVLVRLDSCDGRVTAEVSDPSPASLAFWSSECEKADAGAIAQMRSIADRVELLRGSEGCTLRIVKETTMTTQPAAQTPAYLAHAGSVHLQS